MEGSANLLQQRVQVLGSAVNELTMSKTSLTELEKQPEGSPILIPVGGSAFVYARTADQSKVIIGVGADVSVEMERSKAVEEITRRLEEVGKAQQAAQGQLAQIIDQMQAYQSVAQRLSAELQGEPA